jgi:putative phosphoribosyl transferase
MRFVDRHQAGEALGKRLAVLAPADPVVLALPRGGVPVGYEVALALDCPLDVLLVRKIGVPGQPELAMGAVAEGGVVIRNQGIMGLAGITPDEFQAILDGETRTLAARAALYRPQHAPISPEGKTALVVDDGLATGATALAAVEALRRRQAAEVWVCAPVAPPDTARMLELAADRVVTLETPRRFGAVGAWYRDFGQTQDSEVRDLLASSRLR